MDGRIAKFMEWLRANGVPTPKVEIRTNATGERGLFATAPLLSQEVVTRIPRRLVITQYDTFESPLGRRIAASGLKIRNDAQVAAWLLDEKSRADSFWQPYFETIPTSFPTLPLFYRKEELALLKGSSMVVHIEEHRDKALSDLELLRQAVPELARFSADEFLWARAVLWSRRYSGVAEGHEVTALVPFIDMLNHRLQPNLNWTCGPGPAEFAGTTYAPLTRGTELLGSYGYKSNRRFLFYYGFLEGKAHEASALIYALPDSLPEASRKRMLLAGRDDPAALFRFNLTVPREKDEEEAHEELLSFLRFAQTTREELEQVLTTGRPPTEMPPLNARNEVAALRLFEDGCRRVLAGFETTVEEDDKLLKTELAFNARNCIALRRGEKRLLRHYIDQVRTSAARIERSPDAFNRRLQGPLVDDGAGGGLR